MEENKEQDSSSNYMVPGAIIVAGALIAGAVIYSTGSSMRGSSPMGKGPAALAPGESTGEAGGFKGDLADDDPSLGRPDAPVIMVEFGDFQCPFCGRFFQTAEPKIIDNYVKTGKVKFVYRDYAFLGPESEWAAVAAECAKEQGKFWQYHDYLFSHQSGENQGAFSKSNLKNFAQVLGLDKSRFDSCLDGDKYLAEVRKDTEDGQKAGVTGTPAIFVNGRLVSGAVPYEQFAAVIEEELKKVK